MSKKDDVLSQNVLQKKSQMLPQLQHQMQGLHQRRRRNRNLIVGGACLAFVVAGLAWGVNFSNLRNPVVTPEDHHKMDLKNQVTENRSSNPIPSRLAVLIERNSPDVVERLKIDNTKIKDRRLKLETVDDDELLKMLAENGQPSVLGKFDGQVKVIALREF